MVQTNRQTNRQTDGHGDSMTESAQWGRFSERGGRRSGRQAEGRKQGLGWEDSTIGQPKLSAFQGRGTQISTGVGVLYVAGAVFNRPGVAGAVLQTAS